MVNRLTLLLKAKQLFGANNQANLKGEFGTSGLFSKLFDRWTFQNINFNKIPLKYNLFLSFLVQHLITITVLSTFNLDYIIDDS